MDLLLQFYTAWILRWILGHWANFFCSTAVVALAVDVVLLLLPKRIPSLSGLTHSYDAWRIKTTACSLKNVRQSSPWVHSWRKLGREGGYRGSSWRLDPRKSFASGSMFAINEIIFFYAYMWDVHSGEGIIEYVEWKKDSEEQAIGRSSSWEHRQVLKRLIESWNWLNWYPSSPHYSRQFAKWYLKLLINDLILGLPLRLLHTTTAAQRCHLSSIHC